MVARASPRNGAQPNVHQMSTKLRAAPALRAALLWGCLRAPHAPNAWPAKKLKEMQKLRWRRHPLARRQLVIAQAKAGSQARPGPRLQVRQCFKQVPCEAALAGPSPPDGSPCGVISRARARPVPLCSALSAISEWGNDLRKEGQLPKCEMHSAKFWDLVANMCNAGGGLRPPLRARLHPAGHCPAM